MSEKELSPARHEPTDVGESYAWITVVMLVAAVLILALIVLLLYPRSPGYRMVQLPLPSFPRPELQASPREDMEKFYAQEMQRLNSTGWIDKGRGVVHIPIADAMRLTAQQGIPYWPTAPQQQAGKGHETGPAPRIGPRRIIARLRRVGAGLQRPRL